MVGFHIGNATLVGQAIGRGRPEEGTCSTTSALHITMAYMMLVAAVFVFAPRPLLFLFKAGHQTPVQYAEIMEKGKERRKVEARSILCYWAKDRLGINQRELAKR
jgi:MATE family multidrug resistance protein